MQKKIDVSAALKQWLLQQRETEAGFVYISLFFQRFLVSMKFTVCFNHYSLQNKYTTTSSGLTPWDSMDCYR